MPDCRLTIFFRRQEIEQMKAKKTNYELRKLPVTAFTLDYALQRRWESRRDIRRYEMILRRHFPVYRLWMEANREGCPNTSDECENWAHKSSGKSRRCVAVGNRKRRNAPDGRDNGFAAGAEQLDRLLSGSTHNEELMAAAENSGAFSSREWLALYQAMARRDVWAEISALLCEEQNGEHEFAANPAGDEKGLSCKHCGYTWL